MFKLFVYLFVIWIQIFSSCTYYNTDKSVSSDNIQQNEITHFICFKDFKLLHSDKQSIRIDSLKIRDNFISKTKYTDSIGYMTLYYKFKLNEKFDIYHLTRLGTGHELSIQKYPFAMGDSISILGRKISLTRAFNSDIIINNLLIYNIYHLQLKNQEYLLFQFYNQIFNSQGINEVMNLLIEIKNNEVKSIHSVPNYTYPVYPNYFGDFDEDGQLDFINYNESDINNVDSIYVYSLNNDKFIKKQNYYLLRKKSYIDFSELRGCYNIVFDIDKSKWFYPLKEYYSKGDSCCFPIFDKNIVNEYNYSD